MIRDTVIKEWYDRNKGNDGNSVAKILDVEYAHFVLENGDDFYVTRYGLPFIEHIMPDNFWTDKSWFERNSERLSGTSSIYKVITKEVDGVNRHIVIKWNRMGQDIPGAGEDEELVTAEFNSPFEEFSLVMGLRDEISRHSGNVFIQKPLAIYVPSEPIELDRTGRREYKMRLKIEAHKEIELDMTRSYAVIYEWIDGIDAVQAFDKKIFDEEQMRLLTLDAEREMKKEGFLVRDNKPDHIIVDPIEDKGVRTDSNGNVIYGLIDFELLERTPKKDLEIKKTKRKDYLKRQRDRFSLKMPDDFHPHLHHVNFLGVDYVYGKVESTKGKLWVVGKDTHLFDYFLPERWRVMPKTKISVFSEMYHVITKDNIHLVWKISNVGLQPDMDPFKKDEEKILAYGYNSPFEEVSLAVELHRKGIASIYPRAIYMSGNKTNISENLFDSSRYGSHSEYKTPDGEPILENNRHYMIIWGYWNGPDEKLAAKDGDYYEGIDALRAYKQGIITRAEYIDLLQATRLKLAAVNIEDLNLRGNHILISFDSDHKLVTDRKGNPEIRICNFEFLKRNEKSHMSI
ncbi:MAG: hypothetical protein JW800_03545 [Candidatus Omnitrophica bacterium]|nr:hypothetical protein [Candidatus Omnitrophota bacterium]